MLKEITFNFRYDANTKDDEVLQNPKKGKTQIIMKCLKNRLLDSTAAVLKNLLSVALDRLGISL
uniref:Uncharacterized protein n=1 Tax=Candidozyma auris TaxID=498019 RepID=A0A0L0NZH9_CANAR